MSDKKTAAAKKAGKSKAKAAAKAAKPPAKPPAKKVPVHPPKLARCHYDTDSAVIVATFSTGPTELKIKLAPKDLARMLSAVPWSALPEESEDYEDTLEAFRDTVTALAEIEPNTTP